MAIDPTFTPDSESRLLKIETGLADIWRLMRMSINKGQFNSLKAVRQQEFETLTSRVDSLETSFQELYDRVNNLL